MSSFPPHPFAGDSLLCVHRAALRALLLAATVALPAPAAFADDARAYPACLGDYQPLTVASQMPYVLVSVDGRAGFMVLDFSASVSSITPANFQGPQPPQPLAGSTDRFDDFVFFGSWGTVRLLPQAQPAVDRVSTADRQVSFRQAGVIGTDFLARNVWTLDYRAGRLWRADAGSFCDDDALKQAGYRAVTTADYYGSDAQGLHCPLAGVEAGQCPNIPTIPIALGEVTALAQLDTGYDDGRKPYSVNINAALFEQLRKARVHMRAQPDLNLQLTTCVGGVSEPLEAYTLLEPFGFVDTAGARLPRTSRAVTLFVKRTPAAAAVCGGIGTWQQPAAQLGASFVSGGTLIVDPFKARVWVGTR